MRQYHTTESYIALVSQIHQERYTYDKTVFTKMADKIIVTCKKHGDFKVTAGNHKRQKCQKCFNDTRGDSLRMTEQEFLVRLTERPLYSLVSQFVSANDKVILNCSNHGQFSCTPTRLLAYENTCPSCASLVATEKAKVDSKSKIQLCLDSLPEGISCLTKNPGLSSVSTFLCLQHGEFKSELDRSLGMQYVCNECAKSHFTGKYRVSFEEYLEWVRNLYPNPKHSFELDKLSYLSFVGAKTVKIICSQHGASLMHRHTVNNGTFDTPCPKCKTYAASQGELSLITYVRTLVDCEQGNRRVIAPKELDCYVPSKNVAIEYCGLYWHSEAKLDKNYHLNKYLGCLDKGVRLIQVFEDEWLNNRELCQSVIRNALGFTSNKWFARNLSLHQSTYQETKEFLNTNHLQGAVPSQKYLVLKDKDGVVVACATFSFNRLKNDKEWELVRYCSLTGVTVVGGLSRLCKNFLRLNNISTLISYCNLRWFTGKGYESSGFVFEAYTQPSYYYTNKQLRFSRYSCSKKKLRTLIPNFDENKTEWKNMQDAGFLRIYDCGNAVYRLTL